MNQTYECTVQTHNLNKSCIITFYCLQYILFICIRLSQTIMNLLYIDAIIEHFIKYQNRSRR